MEKKQIKISLKAFIIIAVIVIAVIVGFGEYFFYQGQEIKEEGKIESTDEISKIQQNVVNNNRIEDNNLSNFDLSFLKLENARENKIYSPLSIKYALKMLEEGASGNSKTQISNILGNYNLTKYTSNKNMSMANALYIRNSYKDSVKQNYMNTLKNKSNAEVNFDSFETARNMNNWIKNKTLGIIPEMLEDDNLRNIDFALVNALAIDMEWAEKFILYDREGPPSTEFLHEKRKIRFSG